jgi:adenosylcobinamide-GDP ribazoletransferase
MRSALQFLTILPVPSGKPGPPGTGEAAWAFPIVGAFFGLLCAAILPWKLGPVLAMMALTALTGGLHEDGLADVCDAVRKYRTREQMHRILKDSRIGVYGALALIALFVLRWQALAIMPAHAWPRLVAAYGMSRAQMVLLAATSLHAGEGLGAGFVSTLPRRAALWMAIESVALAALAGWPVGLVLLAANAALLLVVRRWFSIRLGGVTGDCLGFLCVASESLSLAVLAWA